MYWALSQLLCKVVAQLILKTTFSGRHYCTYDREETEPQRSKVACQAHHGEKQGQSTHTDSRGLKPQPPFGEHSSG